MSGETLPLSDFRYVGETHHTPWNGAVAPEAWADTTEPLGRGEEAHRRWPEGRSEQGASKAKVSPPNIRVDSPHSRLKFPDSPLRLSTPAGFIL
ncbi:MAG: hypothetical protein ACKOLA_02445, partial [Spartobacteria bacterium]